MEPDEDPELDISSLIDVSFLLLIYFLVTSTLKPNEADLSIVVPANMPPPDNSDPIDPVSIKIGIDGAISFDNEEIEGQSDPTVSSKLPNLLARLSEYKGLADQAGDTPMVIIAADDDGRTQRFIDVVSVLADVKIRNVTMTGFRDE